LNFSDFQKIFFLKIGKWLKAGWLAAWQTSAPIENGRESAVPDITLDLRAEHYARYKIIRRRVRRQIDAGLRNPDSALKGDFVPKT
jgi:hypothetical protein